MIIKKFLFIIIFINISINSYGYIFINSMPLKADVYIDNKKVGKTPLLIKTNYSGVKNILFKRDGFYDSELIINFVSFPTNINNFMTPSTFSLIFPEKDIIYIETNEIRNKFISDLPEGIYEFIPDKKIIKIIPTNPFRNYIYIGYGVGLSTLAIGITSFVLNYLYYDNYLKSLTTQDALDNLAKSEFFKNSTILSLTLSGISIGIGTYFLFDDINYSSKNRAIRLSDLENVGEDKLLLNEIFDYISGQNISNAIKKMELFVKNYPESRYLPIVLWKRGNIYNNIGETEKAINDLENLKKNYPIYELYELNLKLLGDLYRKIGEYENALANYTELTNFGKYVSNYQVHFELIITYGLLYKRDKDENYKNIFYEYIDKFLNNPNYPKEYKNKLESLKKSGI